MITNKVNEKKQNNIFYGIIDVARYILGVICFGVAMISIEEFDFRTILYLLASIGLFPITYKIISKQIVVKYIWQIVIGISLFCIALYSDEIYIKNINNTIDYYSTAEMFADDVLESGIKLEDVGNDITTYWSDYIYDDKYDSIDAAVDKALDDNSYNITLLKSNHSTIKSYYSDLMVYPENCEHCNEIKIKVQNTYAIYKKLYDLVISPTGSYNDFTDNFGDYDTQLANEYDELKMYLDIYND